MSREHSRSATFTPPRSPSSPAAPVISSSHEPSWATEANEAALGANVGLALGRRGRPSIYLGWLKVKLSPEAPPLSQRADGVTHAGRLNCEMCTPPRGEVDCENMQYVCNQDL